MTWQINNIVVLGSLGLLVFGISLPRTAVGMGAFAMGLPVEDFSQGVAVGISYNINTLEGANAKAMQECQKPGASPAAGAACKIITHFDNSCLAVAEDLTPGTSGFAWVNVKTKEGADDAALQGCREKDGLNPAGTCVLIVSGCDTTGGYDDPDNPF